MFHFLVEQMTMLQQTLKIATAYEKFNDKENVDLVYYYNDFLKQVFRRNWRHKSNYVMDIINDRKDVLFLYRFHKSRCGWRCKRNYHKLKT